MLLVSDCCCFWSFSRWIRERMSGSLCSSAIAWFLLHLADSETIYLPVCLVPVCLVSFLGMTPQGSTTFTLNYIQSVCCLAVLFGHPWFSFCHVLDLPYAPGSTWFGRSLVSGFLQFGRLRAFAGAMRCLVLALLLACCEAQATSHRRGRQKQAAEENLVASPAGKPFQKTLRTRVCQEDCEVWVTANILVISPKTAEIWSWGILKLKQISCQGVKILKEVALGCHHLCIETVLIKCRKTQEQNCNAWCFTGPNACQSALVLRMECPGHAAPFGVHLVCHSHTPFGVAPGAVGCLFLSLGANVNETCCCPSVRSRLVAVPLQSVGLGFARCFCVWCLAVLGCLVCVCVCVCGPSQQK